ncbi:hypothetical protein [Pseudonocardia phyllosphaerae]|uniref:hypothetical protein n=1 Tax=Pseudonocardia phyllosphaerae TaxID=3390502 RepID=UPI00397AFDE6
MERGQDTDADPTVIMVIRHGEKPNGESQEFGMQYSGEHDPHSLSVRGWSRAGALVGLFCPAQGPPRAGLARPEVVYASGHASDGSHRPVQTVTELAEATGTDLHTHISAGAEADLVHELDGRPGPTLVAWQHEAIPDIARELNRIAPVDPAPPEAWDPSRFDLVWTFTRTADGWAFAQVPQLLLDGDSAEPID